MELVEGETPAERVRRGPFLLKRQQYSGDDRMITSNEHFFGH
jgi:hypothetical protein